MNEQSKLGKQLELSCERTIGNEGTSGPWQQCGYDCYTQTMVRKVAMNSGTP